MSDIEYDEFLNWLGKKDYDYKTNVEESIERLVENAKKENYYTEIEAQIRNLESKVKHNKESDLITFKEQIKSILEENIVSRYFLISGEIEASLDDDTDLQTAIKVLNDSNRYHKILNTESDY